MAKFCDGSANVISHRAKSKKVELTNILVRLISPPPAVQKTLES